MARNNVAERVAELEAEVARLRAEVDRLNQPKDWRSAIGYFAGNEGMREVFEEARKIREKDREQARRRFARRKKAKVAK